MTDTTGEPATRSAGNHLGPWVLEASRAHFLLRILGLGVWARWDRYDLMTSIQRDRAHQWGRLRWFGMHP